MVLKDLLVLIGPGMEAAGIYALSLAAACGASLNAAAPIIEPSLPPNLAAEFSEDVLSRIKENAEAAASKAIEEFSQAARDANASIETMRFKAIVGEVGDSLAQLTRRFDAVVLPQPDPNGVDTTDIVEACLFGSGRPLVIVPHIRTHPAIGSVLIAWDGGLQVARAVADALPILALARNVEIVTIRKGEDENPYLRRDAGPAWDSGRSEETCHR